MISKEPDSPENKQREVSVGSKSRSGDKPIVQKRMDKAKDWERTLEFNRKMMEDTN